MSMKTRIVAAGVALAAGTAATAETQASWSADTTDQVRALVAEMMADAQTRSSLLQSGSTAGHDGHFFLASADGNFRLNVSGQMQLRYMLTATDDDTPGVDDLEVGFNMPRTALAFSGHIFEPSTLYRVSTNFSSNNGQAELEDAYFGHKFDNGLLLVAGQLRMPVLWEDMLQETHSLAVDQSVVNAIFAQDRSQGVWAHYSSDWWRMWAGFDDGIRSENTNFTAANEADYGLTTRWEAKFSGDWGQFDAFSSSRGAELGSKLGGAVHFQGGPDQPGGANAQVLAYTADLMFTGDGWNIFAYGVGLYVEPDGAGIETNDFGFLVQGGFFVADKVELFGRYDVVLPDDDRVNDDSFNTVTAGVNYYVHGHAAKFTFDVVWYLDATTTNDLVQGLATGARGDLNQRLGLLPSAEENQISVRAQFQLLF